MHRKHVAAGKEKAIDRIEDGVRRLGGDDRSLAAIHKDPRLVELWTLENIADALDNILKRLEMSPTAHRNSKPKIEPQKIDMAEEVINIVGVDALNDPTLLVVKESGKHPTKKFLRESIHDGSLKMKWETGELVLTEEYTAESETDGDPDTSADTSEDHNESSQASGDAEEEHGES